VTELRKPLQARIEEVIFPRARQEGFELVAVEVIGGARPPVIRIYLDHEMGIDIDKITQANTWISAALEQADPIAGQYVLEVSSPGVDRPLAKLDDYIRYAGERVHLRTSPIAGRSSFTGVIIGVDDRRIIISVDGEDLIIPFDSITKARLKGTIDFSRKGDITI